jgi:hypothetical protein
MYVVINKAEVQTWNIYCLVRSVNSNICCVWFIFHLQNMGFRRQEHPQNEVPVQYDTVSASRYILSARVKYRRPGRRYVVGKRSPLFLSREQCTEIQGYSKRSIHFQKFILQKLLTLNPCPVYGWKLNHSEFCYGLSEAAHHWGCGCCYLWHAATSVGRAGLSIWHLPRHMWCNIECL